MEWSLRELSIPLLCLGPVHTLATGTRSGPEFALVRICRASPSQGVEQLLLLMPSCHPSPSHQDSCPQERLYITSAAAANSFSNPIPFSSLTVPLLSCHGLGSVASIVSHPMGQPRPALIFERCCICRDHPCPGSLWIAQKATVYPGVAGNRGTESGGNLPHAAQRTLHEEQSQPRCNHGPT